MSDDKSKRNRQDSSRVNANENYEVRYWCKKFDCSEDELRSAVDKVGTSARRIGEYIRGK